MQKLVNYMKNDMNDYILMAILLAFIFMDIKVPYLFAYAVNSFLGKVVLAVLVICMFYVNPILGIVSAVAVYELLYRSDYSMSLDMTDRYMPSESERSANITSMNELPDMKLEVDMVQRMKHVDVPFITKGTYEPVMNDMHGAAKV